MTPQDIERRLSGPAEQGLKPTTLNRYRALLTLTYSIAMRNGKVSTNPARLVRLRKENNARVRFLSADEETTLRAKIRETYADGAEFDLALNTGMRRGEQYRLRWQDVNLKMSIITIPRRKRGEKRHIPINSAAALRSKLCGSVARLRVTSAPAPKPNGDAMETLVRGCSREG